MAGDRCHTHNTIITMLVGIFTIDDWHLANGIHCPNLLTWTADDIDSLIDKMWNRIDDCVAYEWKTGVHTPVTKEFVKNEFNNEKYGNLRIHFTKPREGYISIVNTNK